MRHKIFVVVNTMRAKLLRILASRVKPPETVQILRLNQTEEVYLARQKQKTNDPERIRKWQGDEWETKLNGFRNVFSKHGDIIGLGQLWVCCGARTGQEVAALQELGVRAIGVDLVPFPPYTVEGDFHNLAIDSASLDGTFTNVFDHSHRPHLMIAEIERVLKGGGYAILQLACLIRGDSYSENRVRDPRSVISLFRESSIHSSRPISNSHDVMNWEIVMRRNDSSTRETE